MAPPSYTGIERRRHPRFRIALQASVRVLGEPDRPPVLTHSIDMSTGGLLLACVGVRGRVTVTLQLPDRTGRLEVTADVVRAEPGRTAVEFTALDSRQRAIITRLASAVGTKAA
jgi:hypothetical protein